MKKSNVAHSPVAPALLLVLSAAITPSHAFPFLDEDVYAAESRYSVIDPTLGRRMGQDFPEHFAGKDYTAQSDTWNLADLPLASGETFQTGCLGDFNGDGNTDFAAVLQVTGYAANEREMATFFGTPTGFSSSPYRSKFVTVPAPARKPIMKTMDMDGDGDLDIVYMVGLDNTTHELCVFHNFATGTGDFDTATSVIAPVGAGSGNPRLMDVVPMHYNLDGYGDLLVADAANDRILIYLGNSSNTYTLSPVVITEEHPNRLWAADLDRDGRDDLVSAGGEYFGSGTRRLGWRPNTLFGLGSFNFLDAPPVNNTLNNGFAMADVNDDGWKDIVFNRSTRSVSGNITSHNNTLWYRPAVKGNPGAYTGQIEMAGGVSYGWKGEIYGIYGGDIDGDGDDDILTAGGSRMFTYENIHVHGDSASVVTDLTGTLPTGSAKFATGDVDGDSWEDLVATSPNGKAVLWYPGRPAGGFDTPVSISTGSAIPDHACTGDFDADGKTDLVWSIPATGEIKRAFNNNGLGTSWSQGTIATLPGLIWLTAGNINGDADTDLVTVTSSGAISWLLNSSKGTTWTADALPTLSGAAQAIIAKFQANTLKEVAAVGTTPGMLEIRDSNILANPKWQLTHSEPLGTGSSVGVTAGDFNRDGWTDCAWTNGAGTVFCRTPGLALAQTTQVGTVPGTVRRLRQIDWNNDGWDDILVAYSGGVMVFLSQSPYADDDETTGYWTPQVLFTGDNCSDAIAIDIDHDGRMDVAAFATATGKVKLITHAPDIQATVTDKAMEPDVARRANGNESFYVLKLDARSCGRQDAWRSQNDTGGFSDDTDATLNRIRIRFVKAVKSGSKWVPGSALTQSEVAACVEKVFVIRESTTQSNPTLDPDDTILAEAAVSTNAGYMTLNVAESLTAIDDLKPGYGYVRYHIAIKMKPIMSPATTGRFFVQNAPTDPAQGNRCVNVKYWPLDTALHTASVDITEGQLVNPTTSLEAWRYSWFGTYTSSGNASDNADNDRDGMANIIEYLLFKNPTVADARPLLSMAPAGANLAVRADLPAVQREDAIVTLEQSTALNDWTTLAQRTGTGSWTGASVSISSLGGGINRATFPLTNQTKRFYRLNVTVAP
jgi:hypothetical protein